MTVEGLAPGLYEALITAALAARSDRSELAPRFDALGPDAASAVLARHVHDAVLRALRRRGKLEDQLAVTQAALDAIAAVAADHTVDATDAIDPPPRLLLSLLPEAERRLGEGRLNRPSLPLRNSDLIVNGPRDLRLAPEIRRELASADQVDVLLSFLKWSGLRLVRTELHDFCRRRPGQLRVLTTTYMGATEPEAVKALVDMGAEVRIAYDVRRTRLHAKAWLFHRDSGFSTALIGSSNLSHSAMLDGVEWNVRLSTVDNHTILEKFRATFSQYWDDDTGFEPHDEDRLREATVRYARAKDRLASLIRFRPHPHQRAVLEALALERERGFRRNLVVAATGTGKTVVAALDYKRLREKLGDPRLLFVAHRREIVEQSLAVFRGALGDGNFGELLTGQDKPVSGKHVFATVQSLHEARLAGLAPDAYDVVIIDEVHHAPASSYQRLIQHLTPQVLLGLTATPERTDGQSLLPDFDQRIAAELRLWDALDRGLLAPFQYFGVADGVDLSRVDFRAGRYDVSSLDKLYTGDHVRAQLIVDAVGRHIRDPHAMKALGFCVSVAHAEFMAAFFTSAGLPSRILSGESSAAERHEVIAELKAGKLVCVFTVNLFNEGVDIPEVDTVLFLRPTESATVFLQQFGRGLRLHASKECLTVLDFIGGASQKFRFDLRYRALTGGTRAQLKSAVEQDFPFLPAGCAIELEKAAKEAVRGNIRQAISGGWTSLAEDLRALGDVHLKTLLEHADLRIDEVYSGTNRSMAELRSRAKLAQPAGVDDALLRGPARLLHVDDDLRLKTWSRWFAASKPPAPDDEPQLQWMFFAAFGQSKRPLAEVPSVFEAIWRSPALLRELRELLEVLRDQTRRRTYPLRDMPLHVHGTYSREEVAAALGEVRSGKLLKTQSGVLWVKKKNTDVFYVTLEKDAKDFTPTTLYNDYLMSPSHFHWESQGNTPAAGPPGRRYRAHAARGSRDLLFVRRAKRPDRNGVTPPFMFLGPVSYERHEGSKPMQIVWRLHRPAPDAWYQGVKLAAG